MKQLLKICSFAAIVIFIYIFALYNLQDNFIFYPNKYYISPQQADTPVFQENIIIADDGNKIMTWYAQGQKNKPAILFFHGNAFQISAFAEQLRPLINAGYTVLAMEYRGFGNTLGDTRQERIFADAAIVFDWLKAQEYPEIIVYGYSYGCAVSLGLTTLRKPNRLILTAPFASLIRLVKEKPVPFAAIVLKDHYPSEQYITSLNIPLLIIHGRKDKLIPYHHSQILYDNAASPKKNLVLLDNVTHHSIYFSYYNMPIILNWLQENQPK